GLDPRGAGRRLPAAAPLLRGRRRVRAHPRLRTREPLCPLLPRPLPGADGPALEGSRPLQDGGLATPRGDLLPGSAGLAANVNNRGQTPDGVWPHEVQSRITQNSAAGRWPMLRQPEMPE